MSAAKGNKYALNCKTSGRPPVYKNPIDIENRLVEYRKYCQAKDTPITISGLALFLGFESRQSFYDYEKKVEFTYIIKKARLMVEDVYEQRLHGANATGAIFALKNMGWKDEHEISGGLAIHFDKQDAKV